MNVLETDWWLLSLPAEWQADQDEESVVVSDPDDVGELLLTTLLVDDADAIDLKQLMADADIDVNSASPCAIGDFSGFVAEPEPEDDEYVREWYVARDKLILLISYQCDADDSTMDREMIDEILSTLGVKAAA